MVMRSGKSVIVSLSTRLATGSKNHTSLSKATLKDRFIEFFTMGHRQRSLTAISRSESTGRRAKRKQNRNLQIAVGSLALAGIGVAIYPPLVIVSMAGVIYTHIPRFKRSVREIVERGKAGSRAVDAISTVGLIATGQFVTACLTTVLLNASHRALQATEDKSLRRLNDLFDLGSRKAWLIKEGTEVEVSIEQLRVGDLIVVKTGETIPVDGVIMSGTATLDQQSMTGEATPAEKEAGHTVMAASLVLSGKIVVQVERTGNETTAAVITKSLEGAKNHRKHLQHRWEQWLDKTAWMPLLGAGLALPILGPLQAVGVLYSINFGYGMRVVAPLSLLNHLNSASKRAILIKDGRVMETLPEITTVIFDKTGTLTTGAPQLDTIKSIGPYTESALLSFAASAEANQSHPIAKAIVQEAQRRKVKIVEPKHLACEIGFGIAASFDESVFRIGSVRFMELVGIKIPEELESVQKAAEHSGNSFIMVAIDNRVEGYLVLSPKLRPGMKSIVTELKHQGLDLWIASGDNQEPTRHLAQRLGIDHFVSQALPTDKKSLIKRLQSEGRRVCFVGDGINDSVALSQADLSISLRDATSVAIDCAQIVLMSGDLKQICQLFKIGKHYRKNISESFQLGTITSVVSIASIALLNSSLGVAVLLYYLGIAGGVVNSLQSLPGCVQLRGKPSGA